MQEENWEIKWAYVEGLLNDLELLRCLNATVYPMPFGENNVDSSE